MSEPRGMARSRPSRTPSPGQRPRPKARQPPTTPRRHERAPGVSAPWMPLHRGMPHGALHTEATCQIGHGPRCGQHRG